MKKNLLASQVVVAVLVVAVPAVAFAAGPDFSKVSEAVDASTIVTGITAMAGVMMLPKVAKWGFRQIMGFMRA